MVYVTSGNTPDILILAHDFTKSLIYIMYLCMLAPELEDIPHFMDKTLSQKCCMMIIHWCLFLIVVNMGFTFHKGSGIRQS